MPPLALLDLLLASDPTTLEFGLFKQVLIRSVQSETTMALEARAECSTMLSEMEAMQRDMHTLATKSVRSWFVAHSHFLLPHRPITFQGIKCHACSASLTLPAVHFLCQHSFHQRCLPEPSVSSSSSEVPPLPSMQCPKCASELRKVREIINARKAQAKQHDRFLKQIETADTDGWNTVAEYFGRGVF